MAKMDKNRQFERVFWIKWSVPVFLITLIEIAKNYPAWIENNYSRGWFTIIGSTLRLITGWSRLSLGDIFYTLLGFGIVIELVRFAVAILKNISWELLAKVLLKWIRKLMWLYIWFNFLWGLNYFRSGITEQLKLEKYRYCKEDVLKLTDSLIVKVNYYRSQIPDTSLPEKPIDYIIEEAKTSYDRIARTYPFLSYHPTSVKSSLYSKAGMYFGFTGYYNPFSGEAQFRSDIPKVLLPYIICHEIGHQIGYASESEANFSGYLACSSSKDPYFLYSVYLDLFTYAQREEINTFIIDGDTTGLKSAILYNKQHLDSLVKKDRKSIRSFFNKEENKVSPVMSNIYDQYLKLNLQQGGVESYNEVIGWLLAYQKKYGKL
jgi:hypothetical protein